MKFKNQALTLQSDALPADTLVVTKVVGDERLSGLFRFELELLCQDKELDLEAVLYAPVRLGIQVDVAMAGGKVGSGKREIAGVLAELEQQEEGQGWVKFRAVLVPKLWQLTRSHRSRVFMDRTLDELVKDVLVGDGLEARIDFDFQLSRQGDAAPDADRAVYPRREYVVQYEESDWDFVARWLEHEGVFFHFRNDEDEGTEKVVFGDTTSAYTTGAFESPFPYRPMPSRNEAPTEKLGAEEVHSFRGRQTRLPKQVVVADYNWRTPSTELRFAAKVRSDGTGLQAEYNDHFKSKAQGTALAAVRAEELGCRARWFQGESSCRSFRPGMVFTLEQHFRAEWNTDHLLVAVHHEAEQMVSLETSTVTGVKYHNTFEAIPADVCFRPARSTPWPSIKGVMHAKVDGEGDGQYAELDEQGRYKLVLPFDEYAADAKPGKASRWVRMAQPYAGPNAGMHFPLRKGTEVLITHIDGDPDRPIIAGAVPNAETESPATGANRTRNSIRSAGGNVMQIDDDENASGFVFRDARSSRVIDQRWRTSSSSGSAGGGGGPGGGGGGALPARPVAPTAPAATAAGAAGTTPAAAGAVPGGGAGMAEGQIVSTTWDEGVDGSGSADGWRSYFRDGGNQPTAFQEIATKGRYTDETNSPLGLSASDNLLSDLTLNEANIVKMFNHLLEKHPRASETDTVADTQLTGTIGKIVKTARNFEAIASGSQVEVAVGDSIKVSVGDSYEYVDGSFDVKIGTGGYTREETRGDSTVENFVYGKKTEKTETTGDTDETTTTKGNVKSKTTTTGTTNENTTYIGRKEEFTLQVAGGAACTVGIGTATANEIQIGVFNSNTINVIGVAEIGVLVGGKLEISINLAASLKVTLGVTAEFETENFKAILKSDTVALQKFKATLKDDCADLVASKAALSDTNNKLTELNNKLTETSNKLSETKNALNTNTQALSLGMRCLAAQTQHLIKDDVVLFNSSKNAVNNMTSGITIIA